MTNLFATGSSQGIEEVLNNRDQRVAFQENLVSKFPKDAIVAVKLNIPGPIKNNEMIRHLFELGLNSFLKFLKSKNVLIKLQANWNKETGNEAFFTSETEPVEMKKCAVDFEDNDPLGRLFDIDVMGKGKASSISRVILGLPVRKCFICNRPAKECARSRRHSVADLQQKINQVYQAEVKN